MKTDLLPKSNFLVSRHEKKIKIAFIITSLRDGGTERQVLELLHHLSPERFVTHVILLSEAGIERAREFGAMCVALGISEGGNSRWIRRSGALVNAVKQTRAQLLAWHCDIMHSFLPGPSIIGGVAARFARTPVIIGSRRSLLSFYRRERTIATWADNIAFRLAHLNLGNSKAVSREILTLGKCPGDKCRTIYNGVDIERFHPSIPPAWRQIIGWDDGHVVFGMLANFRACKRHIDFVNAAAIIAKDNTNARFLLAGLDHGLRDAVTKRVYELGINDRVQILNSDPSPEKILATLDVYVCTSESEGFSNILLEAMACGKPVIATNVGGNPEAVLDNETGILVPPLSPESIAIAAGKLLANPELRLRMGKHGRKIIEQRFSLQKMVESYEKLYAEMVFQRRGL